MGIQLCKCLAATEEESVAILTAEGDINGRIKKSVCVDLCKKRAIQSLLYLFKNYDCVVFWTSSTSRIALPGLVLHQLSAH
jgi:hypothetical protein